MRTTPLLALILACAPGAHSDTASPADPLPVLLHVVDGPGTSDGDWCSIATLPPGEALLTVLWLDSGGAWRTGSPGWPYSQEGLEVGYREAEGCDGFVEGFRVVSAQL